MAIPGAFVLEQLGAVLALEGQMLGVALQEESEKKQRRCTIRAAVQRAERERDREKGRVRLEVVDVTVPQQVFDLQRATLPFAD